MADLPIPCIDITRFGSADDGLPVALRRRSFEYVGVEAIPVGLASEEQKLESRLKDTSEPGWKATIQAGGAVVALALILNVFLLAYAYVKAPIDSVTVSDGSIALYAGDCGKADKIKAWTHVAINILGTLLLVTSGATMQVLSAPTRQEVDAAHATGKWLDIGLLSVRNLLRISKTRGLLWSILAISSIPLHLVYNSVIFSTVSGTDILSVMVGSNFTELTLNATGIESVINQTIFEYNYGEPGIFAGAIESWDLDRTSSEGHAESYDVATVDRIADAINDLRIAVGQNSLKRMSGGDCFRAFSQSIQSDYRAVILVTTLPDQNQSVIDMSFTGLLAFPDWTCNTPDRSYQNTTDYLRACLGTPLFLDGSEQTPYDGFATSQASRPISDPPTSGFFNLDHCLVLPAVQHCSTRLYPTVLIVVITANFVKLITILYVARLLKFRPLVTIGDAIVSFMQDPDGRTEGIGIISLDDVRRHDREIRARRTKQVIRSAWGFVLGAEGRSEGRVDAYRTRHNHPERPWQDRRRMWFSAASMSRWIIVMIICCMTVSAGGIMLSLPTSAGVVADAIHTGFGKISAEFVLPGSSPDSTTILLANTPQIIISNVYVLYNGLLTSMLLSSEFMDFATRAKAMRVSPVRKGQQRSTYYLQLPYRYSLPLMALMTTLHYTVSESFFLVHIDSYGVDGSLYQAGFLDTIGYSASAILVSVCLGAFIVAIPLLLGFRRFPAGIPLVGNCSLAISSVCHAAKDEPSNAVEASLQFGVLEELGPTGRPRVGFSSRKVQPLQKGVVYDGSGCMQAISLRDAPFDDCRKDSRDDNLSASTSTETIVMGKGSPSSDRRNDKTLSFETLQHSESSL